MQSFDRERPKILKQAGFALTGNNTFWFEDRAAIANDSKLFDDKEI